MIIEHGADITIEDVVRVSDEFVSIALSSEVIDDIKTSNERLERTRASGKPVYGINTGYGVFANIGRAENLSTESTRVTVFSPTRRSR